jgi:hypothetical protein
MSIAPATMVAGLGGANWLGAASGVTPFVGAQMEPPLACNEALSADGGAGTGEDAGAMGVRAGAAGIFSRTGPGAGIALGALGATLCSRGTDGRLGAVGTDAAVGAVGALAAGCAEGATV